MASSRKTLTVDHPIVITFLIFAVIGFMSFAAEVLKPLALAILLSFALAPLCRFLERRGLPRPAAVAFSVISALGILGGVVYVVETQLANLAEKLPEYQEKVGEKISRMRPMQSKAIRNVERAATAISKRVEGTAAPEADGKKIENVRVVEQTTFRERLDSTIGPLLEPLTVASFVVVLVLFMLYTRDDMSDRMIRLMGRSRLSVTTRTLEEVGQRISRYLAMWGLMNSLFGLIVGIGLWAIGVPYAVLWGFMAACLRFIPYVGAAVAFALPLAFSFAHFDGWREPLMVAALYGILETAANSFIEPVVYGKTTGVTALGLLVAAMFWTWLWGTLGLLLSTPLTVCLAVLGKSVPGLSFFATLIGEDSDAGTEVKFYQRLLAMDDDGASAIIEEASKERRREEICDQILIPTLSHAERDHARGELNDHERAFLWRVISDQLEEWEQTPEVPSLDASPGELPASSPAGRAGGPVVGVATRDTADLLALRMLALVLRPSGVAIEIVEEGESPLDLAGRLDSEKASMLVISHVPPEGLTSARYLIRRLTTQTPGLPILACRWGDGGETEAITGRLIAAGAEGVAFHLEEAAATILKRVRPRAATALAPPDLVGASGGTGA
ncbi:AI-2E family transporter [Isosphaeraceae bacterium EP7]